MLHGHDTSQSLITPTFGVRGAVEPIPRNRLAEGGLDPRLAYQLVHDELSLDGNPLLNMASFVTTWMDPEADMLMAETLGKNFIDQEEYPQTSELERRCVSIIADLFNAPSTGEEAVGTSTIGSSEAIHLCGLALLRNWRNRRKAAGRDWSSPNLVLGSHYQVVWEKFVRYFDVEPRFVPLAKGSFALDPEAAVARVDDNTIGVVGILGSTYTGHFDPIKALNDAVAEVNQAHGWQVPIHVDAASGGFVAAFAYPRLEWDFRLPLVRSINVSGHKYGLVYPGIGWALWRDRSDLPEELIFHDTYLGSDQITFDLNFSKSACQVIGQYYNFVRMGREGYNEVIRNLLTMSEYAHQLVETQAEYVDLVSARGGLPVVTIKLRDPDAPFTAHDLSEKVRRHGWIVPAYTLPADNEAQSVLRVVVREGFSRDMFDNLIEDMHAAILELMEHPPAAPTMKAPGHTGPC